ncbi:homeobox protein meis [Aspergillus ibericus CBS 121593]|uniref:Homeobox protein meis n=1 Tax=Aspergillus ibericus CBS 121593 TaxID=1448316 RepID=A0A395GZ02_9EURO|nr:homeobox protein meis [Aspergillus ibericus CBS 121593]RAL00817.1 homeobox protein meis [Aspergillus ibericus CBS 121593]
MEHAHALPKLCNDILSLPPLDEGLAYPASVDPIFALPSELDASSCEAPDALGDSGPSRPRNHQRLSGDAVRTLKTWLKSHPNNPYPTSQEKDDLEQQTGLTRTQISNWFINARRRKRSTGYMAIPQGQSLLSPMERWRHSPPESEAAATDDILRALADPDIPAFPGSSPYGVPQYALSSNDSSGSFILGEPSSSCGHSQSSSSEISIALSHRPPQRPPTPLHRAQPRRRRRKHVRHANRLQDTRRPYQCTFCADTFATKYDWQRHEQALHLPVDQWRCAPDGGLIDHDGTPMCIFCQELGVDEDHLEKTHNYSICRDKPAEQRTFTRKDHLRQHLKLTHHVDGLHPAMTSWRETRDSILSRCGFCTATFHTWPDRVDHVAEHFKHGSDMKQWTGDWGFEPAVQRLVENALPPYLVGREWHTPDPWRTSDVLGMPGEEEDEEIPFHWDVPNALDRYYNVHRDLLAYIRDQMAAGMRPSDQMIQDRARVFAYESDDPWNQTYADDPFWLEMVKQEAGLV